MRLYIAFPLVVLGFFTRYTVLLMVVVLLIQFLLVDKPITFIKNALSPAKEVKVAILDEKKNEALAIAEGDNLSLAIGKKGQNVRLAARLTHYRIDVKTEEQVKEENIDLTNVELK